MKSPILLLITSLLLGSFAACNSPQSNNEPTTPEDEPSQPQDGDIPTPAEILEALGATGVEGATPEAVASYRAMFERLDANDDGIVTLQEYIDSGHFDEAKATAIFGATDRDHNGEMTEDEYVENRIITDEAKLIFADLDTNSDGNLIESEFIENAPFEATVGAIVYGLFDTNGDGSVMVPEYLIVWGAWARGEEFP